MQLAASQRNGHPPPVPPRPNKQITSDAVIRRPKERPPCPTRQAPPPPTNSKPWKQNNSIGTNNSTGRTTVYDSVVRNNVVNQRPSEPPPEVPKGPRPQVNGTRKIVDLNKKSDIKLQNSNNNHNHNHNNNNNLNSKNNAKIISDKKKDKLGGATVVVIDEENDNNIQRQDWLEAGIRYSSTKITLPAEDNERINGFANTNADENNQVQDKQKQEETKYDEDDRREEKKVEVLKETVENQLEFVDLDFSRYKDEYNIINCKRDGRRKK